MAEAAVKDGLDSGQAFDDRLKYHRRRALRDAYFDKSVRNGVPEEEAKKIYDTKVAGTQPEEEIYARHILVATETEAKEVQERLKKGEDFATVAKENSKDPSAEGGDLVFGRRQMLKPFEDAAFSLKGGRNLDPGTDAIRLAHHQGGGKTNAPAANFGGDKTINQLTQQKAQQTLKSLHHAAKIEIVDPEIKKSSSGTA